MTPKSSPSTSNPQGSSWFHPSVLSSVLGRCQRCPFCLRRLRAPKSRAPPQEPPGRPLRSVFRRVDGHHKDLLALHTGPSTFGDSGSPPRCSLSPLISAVNMHGSNSVAQPVQIQIPITALSFILHKSSELTVSSPTSADTSLDRSAKGNDCGWQSDEKYCKSAPQPFVNRLGRTWDVSTAPGWRRSSASARHYVHRETEASSFSAECANSSLFSAGNYFQSMIRYRILMHKLR